MFQIWTFRHTFHIFSNNYVRQNITCMYQDVWYCVPLPSDNQVSSKIIISPFCFQVISNGLDIAFNGKVYNSLPQKDMAIGTSGRRNLYSLCCRRLKNKYRVLKLPLIVDKMLKKFVLTSIFILFESSIAANISKKSTETNCPLVFEANLHDSTLNTFIRRMLKLFSLPIARLHSGGRHDEIVGSSLVLVYYALLHRTNW